MATQIASGDGWYIRLGKDGVFRWAAFLRHAEGDVEHWANGSSVDAWDLARPIVKHFGPGAVVMLQGVVVAAEYQAQASALNAAFRTRIRQARAAAFAERGAALPAVLAELRALASEGL